MRVKRSEHTLPWLAKKAEKLASEVKSGPLKGKNIDIKIPDPAENVDEAASGSAPIKEEQDYMEDAAFAADVEPEETDPKPRRNFFKIAKSNGGIVGAGRL